MRYIVTYIFEMSYIKRNLSLLEKKLPNGYVQISGFSTRHDLTELWYPNIAKYEIVYFPRQFNSPRPE